MPRSRAVPADAETTGAEHRVLAPAEDEDVSGRLERRVAMPVRRPRGDRGEGRPEVPPLPPHIGFQQARAFMTPLAKGDQREGSILADTARQMSSAILPGGK